MSANALLLAGGTPLIKVDAADFDGTNDRMSRGAGLSGVSDGGSGILSLWFRIDGGALGGTGIRQILASYNGLIGVIFASDNNVLFQLADVTETATFQMRTTSGYAPSATWRHLLASWNIDTSATHLYITDASDKTLDTIGLSPLDYTDTNWAIGDIAVGTAKFNGCLAEFYFAPNQYLDFSDVNNRRKFISAGGKPVHLGVDGSLPTGTAPAIYQHLDDGEAVANFATNRGTGGNFAITGTLDTASTSPSD